MSDYDIHHSTAAQQRRMLVSLNKAANKRLAKLAEGLNEGKIEYSEIGNLPSMIDRFYQNSKGEWKYNRFTLKKNATKYAMEAQIQSRTNFMMSDMSKKSYAIKYERIRRSALRNLYNEQNGLQPGDAGYRYKMSQEEYKKLGKLFQRMKDAHILTTRAQSSDEYYKSALKQAMEIVKDNPTQSVNEWFEAIDEKFQAYYKELTEEEKAFRKELFKYKKKKE